MNAGEPRTVKDSFSLADLIRVEDLLLSEVRQDLASLWDLAEDVTNSYEHLSAILDEGFHEVAPEFEGAIAASVLFRAARRSAALELLNIGRRHLAEAHTNRRRALDLLAFSWIAWRTPPAARQWLHANRNWKEYASTYSNRAIGEALKSLGDHVEQWHRGLSQRVHPSRKSLSPALSVERGPERSHYRVGFFDTLPYEGTNHMIGCVAEHIEEFVLMHLECQSAFVVAALSAEPWRPYHERMASGLGILVGRMDAERERSKHAVDSWENHRQTMRKRVIASHRSRTG